MKRLSTQHTHWHRDKRLLDDYRRAENRLRLVGQLELEAMEVLERQGEEELPKE